MSLGLNTDQDRIDLNSFGRSITNLRDFRNNLFELLGDSLFNINDWNTLFNETFRLIKQTEGTNSDEDSLENKAEKIVNHFYKIRVVSKISLSNGEAKRVIPPDRYAIERYKHDVLKISTLPAHKFEQLRNNVEKDLVELLELISYYETLPFVRTISQKPRKPSNHEESIIQEFYSRCIKEQQIILKYFFKGMKKRAIEKSAYLPFASHIFTVNEHLYDYPYEFRRNYQYFDHRIINEVGHRLYPVYEDEVEELEELYKSDKEKFYERLFERSSADQFFQNIFFNLAHLPIKYNRNEIFTELQRLFKADNWLSFYALALPQVEGLFTEMCQVAYNKKYFKSLPDKVEGIRSFHYWSKEYMDYFQFVVPRLRNKFMHTGFDEGFRLKAFDILTDLDYILRAFAELENPLVKIKRLHVRKNPQDFISYKDIASYFSLLNDLSEDQYKSYKPDIINFEKDFLKEHCNLEFTSEEFIVRLPELSEGLTTKAEYLFNSSEFAHNLSIKPFHSIKSTFSDKTQIELLEDFCLYYPDLLEEIESCQEFIKGYKKHLPSLASELIQKLDSLKNRFGKFVLNISELKLFYYSLNKVDD